MTLPRQKIEHQLGSEEKDPSYDEKAEGEMDAKSGRRDFFGLTIAAVGFILLFIAFALKAGFAAFGIGIPDVNADWPKLAAIFFPYVGMASSLVGLAWVSGRKLREG